MLGVVWRCEVAAAARLGPSVDGSGAHCRPRLEPLLTNSPHRAPPSPPLRPTQPPRGIGELVLVYKRVAALAGSTSRVSELLERIRGLSSADEEGTMRQLYLRCVARLRGGWR